MATFRCSECGCDEDTALCNYWSDRVRDIPPVCSVCDPKIGKWHGQFPRLFGVFLVTPSSTISRRESLATLLGRMSLAEGSISRAGKGVAAPSGASYFNEPVPSYKPLTAAP